MTATAERSGQETKEAERVESAQAAERQNQKTLRFFTVWHPRHHPHFLMFCTRGTFRTDLDKKKTC